MLRLGNLQLLCFVLCFSSVLTQNVSESGCESSPPNISSFDEYSHGGMGYLYGLGESLLSVLRPSHSQQDAEELVVMRDAMMGNNSMYDVTSSIKKQTSAIAILLAFAIFIVGLPIAGICFCSCRLCGKCGASKEHKHPSKCLLSLYLLLLAVTISVIVGTMLTFALSVRNTANAIGTIDNSTDVVIKDALGVVDYILDDYDCHVDATSTNLLPHIEETMMTLPKQTIKLLKQHFGFEDAKSILADSEEVKASLSNTMKSVLNAKSVMTAARQDNMAVQMQQLYQGISLLREDCRAIIQRLSAIVHKVEAKIDEFDHPVEGPMGNRLSGVHSTLNSSTREIKMEIQQFMRQGADSIQEAVHEFQVGWNESALTSLAIQVLYLSMLIPCVLIVIPSIFVCIATFIRLLHSEDFASERSSCSSFSGHAALATTALIFLVGWMVMLVASAGFVVGYSADMVCRPLFNDDSMQLLKKIPELSVNYSNPKGGNPIQFNFGEVVEECRERKTMYEALKGDEFFNLDPSMVENELRNAKLASADTLEAIANLDIYSTLPTKQITRIKETLDKWESKMNISFPRISPEMDREIAFFKENFDNTTNLLADQRSRIVELSQRWNSSSESTKEQLEKILAGQLTIARTNITSLIQLAKEDLASGMADCRPVYEVWQEIREVSCGLVGRPVQTIWISAALASLCFLPLIVLLVLVSRSLLRIRPKYEAGMYLYPTISTVHGGGGSICAYDSGSGASDAPLVRSTADGRIQPRFNPVHQRQHSQAFNGYGNNAYVHQHDADSERPHAHNARSVGRFPSGSSPYYASTLSDYPSSGPYLPQRNANNPQRNENRYWQR